jgi:predicted permease
VTGLNLPDLGNTAAMFALILAAGFVAGKYNLLTKSSQSGLTNLILYITLPCTIVNSFKVDSNPSLIIGMGITFLIALLAQALNQLVSVVFYRKEPPERRSVFRFGTIVCNSGFFGMSVIAALFGGVALSYGAIYLIPQRFAMWIFGMAVFTKDKQRHALAKTLIHPAMIAVYIGVTFMFLPVSIPTGIAGPIAAIGGCTMPLSMLLVGSILTETNISMLRDKTLFLYCFLRLIVIPGVVFLGCSAFGVNHDITQVCVLMAGMPAAATTGLLALRYGSDEKLGSTMIVTSTILFFALLPLWMFLLGKY